MLKAVAAPTVLIGSLLLSQAAKCQTNIVHDLPAHNDDLKCEVFMPRDQGQGVKTMAQKRFSNSPKAFLTTPEIERRVSAAVAIGAEPRQAREHFEGQPVSDPTTRFALARVDPRYALESDLSLAVALNLTDIASAKLADGNDPNFKASDGTTPLMDAAMMGNDRLAVLLLQAGAQVNVRNESNATPLKLALSNGADQVVQILLAAGADYCEPGLLSAASSRSRPDTLKRLIELGLDVNENGGQPLVNAAASRNLENIQVLLRYGANANARGGYGRSPLILVTRDDDESLPANTKIVEMLLLHGADVNLRDDEGWTALMGAARDGDATVVQLLLESGAKPNVSDDQGNSPLSLAKAKQDPEIVKLLSQCGAVEETQ